MGNLRGLRQGSTSSSRPAVGTGPTGRGRASKLTGTGAAAAAVSLALVLAACGSSKSSSSTPTTASGGGSGGTTATTGGSGGGGSPSGGPPDQLYNTNSSGSSVKGGVLTMLGVGDVDYMDPNISYYSIGYLNLRMWARGLYAYPATTGSTTTAEPDLATAAPTITGNGLKYAVTLRTGAMWDTTPSRQVTAADVVRGVKRTCNPAQPFGGQPDFSTLIAGYSTFCAAFAKVAPTVPAIKAYIDGHTISGVSVDPANPLTVDFTLTHAASYFADQLTLSAFDPAPVESLDYVPASNAFGQHTISDGPYKIQSYNPTKSIDYVRNPAWSPTSDPIRKAYVDEIKVTETGNQDAILQQVETNSPAADLAWDTAVPPSAAPGLISSQDKRLQLQSEYSSNPYVLFNTVSPNNNGALAKVQVRQALEYALNRSNLIQDDGGPKVAPPLTQVLPPGITGASPSYSMYSYDPVKSKQLLAAAGYPNGLTLKFLYRPASVTSANSFQTVQADLAKAGIKVTGVGVPNADFYTKYLQVPRSAKAGQWDVSLAGWSPDWYGNAALSFFSPLFDGRVLPPISSNFGLFSDPTLNALIDKASVAPTVAGAATLWHQADVETMKQAAIFPITDPNDRQIHGSQVHNCVYIAALQQCDPTNIWLKS